MGVAAPTLLVTIMDGLTKVQPDIEKRPVSKVASITLPYDLQGRLLELELKKAAEEFVRAMELRGWTLMRNLPIPNPQWTTDGEGRMAPYLAIDWEGNFPSTKRAQEAAKHYGDPRYPTRESHQGPLPTTRETSLEDTDGNVEYRCVGVFIAPEVMIEQIMHVKSQEEAAKNRVTFGPTLQ